MKKIIEGFIPPPMRDKDSPLYDLSATFPDDIYSSNGIQYYGDRSNSDGTSISIIQSSKGKPNNLVTIYRAIPKIITNNDKIRDLEQQKAYILKSGRIPSYVDTNLERDKYYDSISDELTKLQAQQLEPSERIVIMKGDWVTISRSYAVQHGQSALRGRYRIISKTVKASELFTDGNSIHEWGYDPI